MNIVEEGRNCSLGAISPLSTIFCDLILDFCVKIMTIFSLRDKRLFEIIEVEITRVDCMFIPVPMHNISHITLHAK